MPIEYSEEVESDGPETVEEETIQIPSSLLGGKSVSAGDVVRLEVVDVDGESGVFTVKYPKEKKATKGVDVMAAEFGE